MSIPKGGGVHFLFRVDMTYCGGESIQGQFLHDDELSLAYRFKTYDYFQIAAIE